MLTRSATQQNCQNQTAKNRRTDGVTLTRGSIPQKSMGETTCDPTRNTKQNESHPSDTSNKKARLHEAGRKPTGPTEI